MARRDARPGRCRALTHLLYPAPLPQAIDPTHDKVGTPRVTTLNGINFTVLQHARRWRNGYVQSLECVHAAFPQASFPRLRVCARHGEGTSGALGAGDESVQFESDAFNQAYHVSAENSQYAFEIISATMIEWFLAAPTLAVVDFDGDEVLVAFTSTGSAETSAVAEGALAYAVGMLDRMPARTWSK